MSESPRMYSEREVVLREREAYKVGAYRHATESVATDAIIADAVRRYPLPSRPRVVPDPHGQGEWRVVDGKLCARNATITHSAWAPWCAFPTPERVEMWAALLASPTEEVPDEGGAA